MHRAPAVVAEAQCEHDALVPVGAVSRQPFANHLRSPPIALTIWQIAVRIVHSSNRNGEQ
jgi:hypothetical protein